MEKIYKTSLIYLPSNSENEKVENISLDEINTLNKIEIYVSKSEEDIYNEISINREYKYIDINNLCKEYESGLYIIKPNEINDRLDNNLNGYYLIEKYLNNGEEVYIKILEFENKELEKTDKKREEDKKIVAYIEKNSEELLKRKKRKQKILKK